MRRYNSRLEVSDNVGDLLSGSLVDETGEAVVKGRGDEDVGKGDSLSNKESLRLEDLVKELESGDKSLVHALESLAVSMNSSCAQVVTHTGLE